MAIGRPPGETLLPPAEVEDDFPILELILRNYLNDDDVMLVRKAYFFAYDAHKDQIRASGEPYISHPVATAEILAQYQLDAETISAGLLHDILEDTDYTHADLVREFGEYVAKLVQGVTKVGEIGSENRSEEEIENFRRMMVATAEDLRVIVIKLADRLHNLRTLQYLPRNKQITIATNTLNIYAPLAHRLGLGRIKWELEDLCLMYLHPDIYETIKKKVALKRREREQYLKEIIQTIERTLSNKGIKATVEGRAKHFYSIYAKMLRDQKDFEDIYDLIAVRVICETVGECYAILGEVHTMWRQIPGRFKDYISTPKANNYRSIHTTILTGNGRMAEIQIRTTEMHSIAEHGIAAHWLYKEEGKKRTSSDSKWLEAFSRELPDTRDPEDFLHSIRSDLFSDEVYVYTPKGELIRLPNDATPIDYAYKIHTQLGHRCGGAKVNGRMVPLNYSLNTGDVVEILSNQNSHPSHAWLDIVKTSSARNKIRRYLLESRRDQLLRIGKSTLTRELQKAGYKSREFFNSPEANTVSASLGQKTLDDVFVNIGFGRISPKQVISRLMKKNNPQPLPQKSFEKKPDREPVNEKSQGSLVRLADIDDIMYRIAKCCNPLPGDSIIGFVTRGRGVTIHKENCRSIRQYASHPERILSLFWKGDRHDSVSVVIEIRAWDRQNLLGDLSQIISSTGSNIIECNTRTTNSKATLNFKLEVTSINHLENIMQQIMSIEGVKTVRRLCGNNRNGLPKNSKKNPKTKDTKSPKKSKAKK